MLLKILARHVRLISGSYYNKLLFYSRTSSGSIEALTTFTKTDIKSYTDYYVDDPYINIFPNSDFSKIYLSYSVGTYVFNQTGETTYSETKISDDPVFSLQQFGGDNLWIPIKEVYSENLKYFIKYKSGNDFILSTIIGNELVVYNKKYRFRVIVRFTFGRL